MRQQIVDINSSTSYYCQTFGVLVSIVTLFHAPKFICRGWIMNYPSAEYFIYGPFWLSDFYHFLNTSMSLWVSTYVFTPWCSPFFHIWPVAMSQWLRSEVSSPRHNSLSGKNNSVMPQSSYIVWDDSESAEAYCLVVFVVQVHCCGMWGFPPSWVFLDLCVNSRELCIMLCSVGSKGAVSTPVHMWESVCQLIWLQRECVSVCVVSRAVFFVCRCISLSCKTRIRFRKGNALKAWLIETDARPVFHWKFHGVFTHCCQFDSSRLTHRVSVENSLGLDTACPLKCFEGASPGHLGVSDLPG